MTDTDTLPQSRLEVPEGIDERAFFTLPDGTPTLAGHADLEAVVPNEEKSHLQELERYWVNKPFAFVVIYQNITQQEYRYYLVEPSLSDTERALVDFFADKLKLSIDYETVATDASPTDRAEVVRDEAIRLMHRYNLLSEEFGSQGEGIGGQLKEWLISVLRRRAEKQARSDDTVDPVPVDRDPETGERQSLSDEQVETLVYYLVRNFIRYDRIDGLKHDVNVEDLSCDGYNEPVFVYHSNYGQVLTNVTFGEEELDEFVIELAQRARKGISKRQPNVDATLEDGSRAQLTLGREVSDRGTNFTIRQFKEVPFTPVDLVAWETYSLSQMVYLWLAIESNKSIVIAGGTASGKTTTLNALSLFIPSDRKLVSIEDTRELLMPQRNWVPTTTRESFQADDGSEIDEFDLLEDALRKRPDYIIMGEVRGEEGRTLFQAMNTGHTVCTTFHANSPKEVIRRFTEEPINVASSMFGAVDIVANQTSTTVDGQRVRRATGIVEIDEYDAQAEEFVVDRTYDWDSVADEIRPTTTGTTDLMEQVRLDNGWTPEQFQREWRERKALLAYLIREGIDTYAGVAATIQAYTHSPELTMSLVSRDELADRIDELTTMRTIDIDVDDEIEDLVPRPTPSGELREEVESVLDDATDLFEGYDPQDTAEFRRVTGDSEADGAETQDPDAGQRDAQQSGETGGDTQWVDQFPEAGGDRDRSDGEHGRSKRNTNGTTPERTASGTGDGHRSGGHPGDGDETEPETEQDERSNGVTRVPSPEPRTDRDDDGGTQE
jgi:flagellar protein FlaI